MGTQYLVECEIKDLHEEIRRRVGRRKREHQPLIGPPVHWAQSGGRLLARASYLHQTADVGTRYVFPDLTSTAHIKLNCKLKLLDRADQICSRAPANFLSGRQWQGR